MFWVDLFMDEFREEAKRERETRRLQQIRYLVRKFLKARRKGDMTRMHEAGFHLIPLFRNLEVEEIRGLFREIEKESGYK